MVKNNSDKMSSKCTCHALLWVLILTYRQTEAGEENAQGGEILKSVDLEDLS